MTLEEVEKTVKQALCEFRQTMLNEHTAQELTDYIVERLRIERHLRELKKQREVAQKLNEHLGVSK